RPGAVLYSLEGDFGFSPENATDPAPVIGHEVKLINFNQLPDTPLSLQIQNFARNSTGDQAFVTPNINGFNRPTNLRFGPDGCAAGGTCTIVSLQYVGVTAPVTWRRPGGSSPALTARMPRRIWLRNMLTPRSVAPRCSKPWIAMGRCETWAS